MMDLLVSRLFGVVRAGAIDCPVHVGVPYRQKSLNRFGDNSVSEASQITAALKPPGGVLNFRKHSLLVASCLVPKALPTAL